MEILALKAFVIGPIGDRDAAHGSQGRKIYEEGVQVLEEVIVPACTGFGIEVVRADMMATAGEIPEQIFRQLRDSPLVIADLTSANPNVMYELGLRHTTGKLTIQVGERERLPFDVAAIRTIMFKRTEGGLVQARKDLSKALAANLDSGGDPVTATRIWFESPEEGLPETAEPEERKTSVKHEDDAPGFLELLADTESGSQSMAQTLSAASAIMQDITQIYTDATAAVREADARGGGAAARLALADRTASQLEEPAARLEVVSGDYERTVQRIEPGLEYLLKRLIDEPEQLAEVPEFPAQLRTLVDAAGTMADGALGMRQNTLEMGKASRTLRRVGSRLAASFTKMAEVSIRVANWRKLLDQLR